jgi:CspA family cold shock protein
MKMTKEYVGKIIWFNSKRGYGFISWEEAGEPQKDLFLHWSDIQMEGYKTVKAEQLVSFCIGQTNKGLPKAVSVRILGS